MTGAWEPVVGFFSVGESGQPEIVLDEPSRLLLGELCGQLIDLVQPEDGGDDPLARELGLTGLGSLGEPTPAPELPQHPALARLLPDAYADDPAAASEFRRYTEYDLRLRKRDNARTVQIDLAAAPHDGHITLDAQRVQAWLGAINDLRLALGTTLGVTEEDDGFGIAEAFLEADGGAEPGPDADEDDPRAALAALYHWLGLLQQTLLEALTP